MNIVGISGSPSPRSRSSWLLQLALTRLEAAATRNASFALRDLPPVALLQGDASEPSIREAIEALAGAHLVVVSTPIYKAAYSGLLKLFLDLLPSDALRGKSVLPLVTGGSPGHLLALDYALKPVLSVMGARDVLDGVFVVDSQLPAHSSGGYVPDASVVERLDRALAPLASRSGSFAPSIAPRLASA